MNTIEVYNEACLCTSEGPSTDMVQLYAWMNNHMPSNMGTILIINSRTSMVASFGMDK